MSKVVIIGGGAAGMLAGISAASIGHDVVIIEQNEKLGKKLFITGKGRCNVTNASDMQTVMEQVVSNPRFLHSAFREFTNTDICRLIEQAGCRLKVERGNRVFPVSDKSSDVLKALEQKLRELGVAIRLFTKAEHIVVEGGRVQGVLISKVKQSFTANKEKTVDELYKKTGRMHDFSEDGLGGRSRNVDVVISLGMVKEKKNFLKADAVIVTTGGVSYQPTGSRGDGHIMALELGHHLKKLMPSLVPFVSQEKSIASLQGLTLEKVEVKVLANQKEIYRRFGEMLFTHFGMSGPALISASSYAALYFAKGASCELSVDLKPARSAEEVEQRILREFREGQNKAIKNILPRLFPQKLIPVVLEKAGMDMDLPIHSITKEQRRNLVKVTKDLRFSLLGLRSFKEAIITKGGIDVKEINPKTMESKLVKALYFAGEILDLDALTGGYNLQIAWSTGWVAGASVE